MHPFDEGFMASYKGHPITDNPYPQGSTEFIDWARGWTTDHELPF